MKALLCPTFLRSSFPSPSSSRILQYRSIQKKIRVILQADLPSGKAYAGDVVQVAPGYARNFLIPKKMALYATYENFKRLDMKDPDKETPEERLARLARERDRLDDKDAQAADMLQKYFRNKILKIWRNIDLATGLTHPGMVDAKAVRQKISKQLRIDLDAQEKVHLYPEQVLHSEFTETSLQELVETQMGDAQTPCNTAVKELGEYVARVSLRGGHMVPLKVEVLKR